MDGKKTFSQKQHKWSFVRGLIMGRFLPELVPELKHHRRGQALWIGKEVLCPCKFGISEAHISLVVCSKVFPTERWTLWEKTSWCLDQKAHLLVYRLIYYWDWTGGVPRWRFYGKSPRWEQAARMHGVSARKLPRGRGRRSPGWVEA